MNERLSLHICTFNRPDYLANLLGSLHNQTHQDFDILIVDDFSDTPILQNPLCSMWIQFLRNNKHRVTVIRNPTRLGITKSRNTAVMNDKDHELLVRIDDDSFAERDYLDRLLLTYRSKIVIGEKVGGVGGIVPYPGTSPYYLNAEKIDIFNEVKCNPDGTFTKPEWGYNNPRDDGHFHWKHKDDDVVIKSHHLRSSFLFTKQTWLDAGKFPDELGGNTGFREETLFSLKMLEAGYSLWTDTKARLWHFSAQGKGRNFAGRDYKEIVDSHDKKFRARAIELCKSLIKKKVLKVEK